MPDGVSSVKNGLSPQSITQSPVGSSRALPQQNDDGALRVGIEVTSVAVLAAVLIEYSTARGARPQIGPVVVHGDRGRVDDASVMLAAERATGREHRIVQDRIALRILLPPIFMKMLPVAGVDAKDRIQVPEGHQQRPL